MEHSYFLARKKLWDRIGIFFAGVLGRKVAKDDSKGFFSRPESECSAADRIENYDVLFFIKYYKGAVGDVWGNGFAVII